MCRKKGPDHRSLCDGVVRLPAGRFRWLRTVQGRAGSCRRKKAVSTSAAWRWQAAPGCWRAPIVPLSAAGCGSSEAPGFGQPVLYYDRLNRGAQAYGELARELIKNNG